MPGLLGSHAFTDHDGSTNVLDFQKDHAVSTIKGLLAEPRDDSCQERA